MLGLVPGGKTTAPHPHHKLLSNGSSTFLPAEHISAKLDVLMEQTTKIVPVNLMNYVHWLHSRIWITESWSV